jgi:Xaa-Pro aminopeptidase
MEAKVNETLAISDSEYGARISALRKASEEAGIDVLVVYGAHRDYQPADLRYLARWYCIEEETACLVVPKKGSTTLITDAAWDLERAKDEAFADEVKLARDLGSMVAETIRNEAGPSPRVGIAGFHIFPAPAYLSLLKELPDGTFQDASNLTEEIRIVKSPAELDLLRAASRISDQAMAAGLELIEEDNTEIDVASAAESVIRQAGAEPSFATEMGAGPRTALGTFLPGGRRFRRGQLAVLDCGARLNGYHGDMCRTKVVGGPDGEQKAMLEAVEHSVEAAIDAVKPGVTVGAIRDVAADAIDQAGYGDHWWDAFMPHGNGAGQHEAPNAKEHPDMALREGMVLCIEPGITLPDEGAVIIEQMITVGAEGAEVLNQLPTNTWDSHAIAS